MSAFDDFVTAVENVTGRQGKQQGGEIVLLCPAHDDHKPSLSVREGDDGRPLATCHSQHCSWEAICAAIGWTSSSRNGDGDEWTPRGPAIAIYHYVDEEGRLLFDVCRTADKQFPQRRPDSTSKTGWRWKLGDTRRVLYRLPAVLAAVADGRDIWVTEGEKHADLLRLRRLVATCNPGGAGKWRDEFSDMLDGAARVFVLADDDQAGRKHADQIARSLHGRVDEVRLVRLWTDGESKKDIIDLYSEAESVKDADRALLAAVESTPVYVPSSLSGEDVDADPTVTFAEFVASKDETSGEPLITAEQGTVLPPGGLVILAAKTGDGKTTLTVEFVLHASAGLDYLGLSFPRPLRVLVIENEGPREAFREKLEARLEHWEHERDATAHLGRARRVGTGAHLGRGDARATARGRREAPHRPDRHRLAHPLRRARQRHARRDARVRRVADRARPRPRPRLPAPASPAHPYRARRGRA